MGNNVNQPQRASVRFLRSPKSTRPAPIPAGSTAIKTDLSKDLFPFLPFVCFVCFVVISPLESHFPLKVPIPNRIE